MANVFPPLSRNDILAFQFSSWYPRFEHVSIKSTIIHPLGGDFKRYLLSDGVHIPEGSDNNVTSQEGLSETSTDSHDELDEPEERFAFPDIDAKIRKAIENYNAVFPKLNFSSPKDASWILPSSSPLKCTSPSEVYMLLKSSDFISHDIEPETVFDGCIPEEIANTPPYELELVLRKWYHVDPAREFRCFVRSRRLLAITQRDTNYYAYMNEQEMRNKVQDTITSFWIREIENAWTTDDYTFDVILTRDLQSAHIVDFNPYAPRTDPLLLTYDELSVLYQTSPSTPIFRTVDSGSHEAATRKSPANVHNMVPLDMISMSSGQSIDSFARDWQDEIQAAMKDDN